MQVNVGMQFEPTVALPLGRVQVIQNDVDLFAHVVGYHIVHEIGELPPPAPGIVGGFL